jgi:hypothetical protein
MKRTTRVSSGVLAILAAVSVLPGIANAKSHPTLTVPSCLTTTNDGTTIVADWSNVPNATKYSVEFVGAYTDPVAMVTVTQDFNYDTAAPASAIPTVSVPDADFTIAGSCGDITTCPLSPDTLSVHVKGLNPPVRGGSQNNPFTGFVDLITGGVVDNNGSAPDACTPI